MKQPLIVPLEDVRIYLHWVEMALTGGRPDLTDEYFKENQRAIRSMATALYQYHGYSPKVVYRGILLDPHDLKFNRLQPLPYIKYLSFSEEKGVAEEFADTKSVMSEHLMARRPTHRGYLIEHLPEPTEVIYHYKWGIEMRLDHWFGKNPAGESIIEIQKEVILEQRFRRFKVKEFIEKASLNTHDRTHPDAWKKEGK